MDWTQAITIIGSILVPLLACFGWILNRMARLDDKINGIGERVARIEGMLSLHEPRIHKEKK